MTPDNLLLKKLDFKSALLFIGILLFTLQLEAFVISDQNSKTGEKFITTNEESSLDNYRCVNGHLHLDLTCSCNPCWDGPSCEDYIDDYAPRFLIHKATVVVPTNATGLVYRAWSSDEDLGLTCPLGPGESSRCPCASVRYQLFSPPGDHHFVLHSDTGILERSDSPSDDLELGSIYTYKVMVQSIPLEGVKNAQDLMYDILDLEIFAGSPHLNKIPWT